jgi:virulence-associated protein VapD
MFAISFDLVVRQTESNHPRGVAQAYQDIANELGNFGLLRIQGSVYISDNDDLASLFRAIMALKRLPWFANSVRDIRAFKVEHCLIYHRY